MIDWRFTPEATDFAEKGWTGAEIAPITEGHRT